MSHDLADGFVFARALVEVDLAADMAEQVRIDAKANVPEHGVGDLRAKRMLRLRLSCSAREKSITGVLEQRRPMLPEVPFDELNGLRREFKFDHFAVFHLGFGEDEIQLAAELFEMTIDLDRCKVLDPNGRHLQQFDSDRHLRKNRRATRRQSASIGVIVQARRQTKIGVDRFGIIERP